MKNLGLLFLIVTFLAGAGCASPAPAPNDTAEPTVPTITAAVVLSPTAVPAPSETPTSAPLAGAACLPGEWQPGDLQGQMERSLQDGRPGTTVEAVEGRVVYRFTPDGQFSLSFEQFLVKLRGESNGKTYQTSSLLNGNASARYQVDESNAQLELSEFGGEGVLMTVTVNEQPLFEANLSAWPAFFASLAESIGAGEAVEPAGGNARLSFDCLEDRLVISRIGSDSNAELELARMP